MTTSPTGAQKTGLELRAQILEYVEDTLTASGIPDGWHHTNQRDGDPWDPATAEFLSQQCYTSGNHIDHQRLELDLFHDPVGDTVGFANHIAEHWRSRGYIVTTVVGPIMRPGGGHATEIRADRPGDGSLLAGVTAQDELFSLDFYSECSTDPTLDNYVGPNGYRTWDPFALPAR